MKILPFEALGYRFEDIRGLRGNEKIEATGELLKGIKRVTPEVRCRGHPLKGKLDFGRPEKHELTFEESQGDIPPINFAAFDPKDPARKVVGVYGLYGIRVIFQTQCGGILRARPWPAFNNLNGRDWATLGLDMVEWFLENDLISDDGRIFFFEGLDFSTYYVSEEDPDRTEADGRIEWIDREYTLRKRRKENPLRGVEKRDALGRKIVMIDRPGLIRAPYHRAS